MLQGSFRNPYDSTLFKRTFSRVNSAADDTDTVLLPVYVLPPDVRTQREAGVSEAGDDDGNVDAVVSLTTEDLRRILSQTSDCERIRNVSGMTFIAHGWNKAVYKATLEGRDVAMKTVDLRSELMGQCLQEGGLGNKRCYDRASMYLLKELLFLRALRHQHVVRVSEERHHRIIMT